MTTLAENNEPRANKSQSWSLWLKKGRVRNQPLGPLPPGIGRSNLALFLETDFINRLETDSRWFPSSALDADMKENTKNNNNTTNYKQYVTHPSPCKHDCKDDIKTRYRYNTNQIAIKRTEQIRHV